jgi:hypothetical protein
MHAEAERTARELLPDIVGRLLERHEQRRSARRAAWRDHNAAARAREAAYHRMAEPTAERAAPDHGVDREAGLEL